jgi:glycosyltransferase involved in cell wall biosynthesis
MSVAPEIAVVILSMGAPPVLVGAVRSILDQGIAAEIVVVNSAGGDAAALLHRHGIEVPVIEREERLFAGGARNLGIAATKAPYVAFLADDCLAAPGWLSHRLRLHKAGHKTLASAVLHDRPESRVAWAHHLLLFARRLPGLPPRHAVRYGVSFVREVLEDYGPYDASLRAGEDTNFLDRLPKPLKPVWAPSVVTLHRNCDRTLPLLWDMFRRGHRYALSRRLTRSQTIVRTLKDIARHHRTIFQMAEVGLKGRRRLVKRVKPLIALGTACKLLGAASAIFTPRPKLAPRTAPAGRRVKAEA